ncbi:alpha-N-acetylglucosaminidase [Acetobacter oeni]|nr:alpha-N-acetylglucosaminidase [Acetobacter oeni]MBB3884800.1 alpha-N-acetylglucosaminidase [Acetobacter oeni]NHO20747.1 alpha-N-acetylglucosaminidase [Acetobacter oeni]
MMPETIFPVRRRNFSLKRTLMMMLALGSTPIAGAHADDVGAARDVVARLLPDHARQISLELMTKGAGPEQFRVTGHEGAIHVSGTSDSALLFGVNWYLKHVAHATISPNEVTPPSAKLLPAPAQPMEGAATLPWRYALNENTDGYTSPYWNWPRWRHEIDVYAMNGLNTLLIERGTDAVLYRTFLRLGYTDQHIRSWLSAPAHINWQLMANMCCYGGPLPLDMIEKRAESARQIIDSLHALGMKPVLPGFYGMVPDDFGKRFPAAHVIRQGEWNRFTRPAWLDPRDPLFAKVASIYYDEQKKMFGNAPVYDIQPFQEGGSAGDVPIAEAGRGIQTALDAAHPGALWMMMAWYKEPDQAMLAGVDRSRLFIVDLEQNTRRRDDRARDFLGAPFLYGGLWDFGGRTSLGGPSYEYGVRLPELWKTQKTMIGTAIFPEGMDNNPYIFDLFTEAAWRTESIDLPAWTQDYADRRYGQPGDPHARKAWSLLLASAFSYQATGINDYGETSAAPDSLFNAQPSLDTRSAAWNGMKIIPYKPEILEQAMDELRQSSQEIRATPAWRYDMVDVTRQAVANRARALLPEIKDAFEAHDLKTLHALTTEWLDLMDRQDKLLSTNSSFLVGTWLKWPRSWSDDAATRALTDYDARVILTNWGGRTASQVGHLRDYANKDWAGLTRDYYMKRWTLFFDSLETSLKSGKPPSPIDWYAVGEDWCRNGKTYPDTPSSDTYAEATNIAAHLRDHPVSAQP